MSPTDPPPVLTRRDGPVTTVSLNRPAALNAFDRATVEGLIDAFAAAAADPEVRVIVLTGAGRAFCAGGDLRALKAAADGRLDVSLGALADRFHELITAIHDAPKPVVAAVNGVAAGGGFSLALACDLRVMAEGAFLQQAYTSNGLCVDGGGTFTLPRLVGVAKALELVMLDPRVPAAECLRLGLAARVFPDEGFAAAVAALAAGLAAKPVGALARVKRLVRTAYETDLAGRLAEEAAGIAEQAAGPEGGEGIAAFLEKRKPAFG